MARLSKSPCDAFTQSLLLFSLLAFFPPPLNPTTFRIHVSLMDACGPFPNSLSLGARVFVYCYPLSFLDSFLFIWGWLSTILYSGWGSTMVLLSIIQIRAIF